MTHFNLMIKMKNICLVLFIKKIFINILIKKLIKTFQK